MRSVWLRVLVVLAMAFGLAACGGDEIPDANSEAGGDSVTEEGGNPELYCELVAQLDEAGDEAFAELEKDENATDKDYEKAERDFVESNQETLDALIEAGPDEIADDIRTIIESIRGRAGLGPKVSQAEAITAEKNTQRYERKNC